MAQIHVHENQRVRAVLPWILSVILFGSHADAFARVGVLRPGGSRAPDSLVVERIHESFRGLRPSFESLAFTLSQHVPVDDDLRRTYGTIQTLGLRLGLRLERGTELHLGVAAGCDHGDPYYDVEDFTAGDAAHLTLVPLEIGSRRSEKSPRGYWVNAGWSFDLAWMSETNPTFAQGGTNRASEGWQYGMHLFAGPEWRSAGDRRAIGLELALGLLSYPDRPSYYSGGPERVTSLAVSMSTYITSFF